MKVVIDEKIPYLKEMLSGMGCDVKAMSGSAITGQDVSDAVALFVRTRTKCVQELLDGSVVRFIGTATVGYDHIDTAYCDAKGIEWHNAAGCNAGAVLQYVQSVVYSWARDRQVDVKGLVLGVVGVGNIGTKVAGWARSVGMTVLLNDPPRASRGETGLVSLEEIALSCDIVTFHPSLEVNGDFPSYHLADSAFFAALKRCRLLINASRGEIFDNVALYDAVCSGLSCDVVLDVWENEPQIHLPLLNKVYLGTPHIAGYSAEGKANASRMVVDAFSTFMKYEKKLPQIVLPPPAGRRLVASSMPEALLKIYSPAVDSDALKCSPDRFEELRNNYSLRREPSGYEIVICE